MLCHIDYVGRVALSWMCRSTTGNVDATTLRQLLAQQRPGEVFTLLESLLDFLKIQTQPQPGCLPYTTWACCMLVLSSCTTIQWPSQQLMPS
jgi:hypothetical protein